MFRNKIGVFTSYIIKTAWFGLMKHKVSPEVITKMGL